MSRNPISEESTVAWTPDFFGPIFKKHSLTVKQALDSRDVNAQICRMATFLPDEVLYATDLSEKNMQNFRAVLMALNIPGLSMLFKRYIHDKNGGSLGFNSKLNDYIDIVVCKIYYSNGDILKFSPDGLLAAWKVHNDKFMFDVVQSTIVCAMNIQNSTAVLRNFNDIFKTNIAISAGDVTFSVIGSNEARHFVICGLPIEELKSARNVSLPNDLILSLSAWQHCTPSHYKYVIKDPYNVKIVKVLKQSNTESAQMSSTTIDCITSNHEVNRQAVKPLSSYRTHLISINGELYSENEVDDKKNIAFTAISEISALNPNLNAQIRSYLIKPVIQQIENAKSLNFLAEIRRLTVIFIDIVPDKHSNNKLIFLVDRCFVLLHSIVTQYGGCINGINLYEKNIFFNIVFGLRGYSSEVQFSTNKVCKNGIMCATDILRSVKTIAGIKSTFIGVSTGIAYCGVIGSTARRYYAIVGPPVDKAIRIMDTSCDKVSCDYDTVLHSHINKSKFRSRGVKTLQRLEKHHIYEYLGESWAKKNLHTTLDYCYPILGRLYELEYFDDILNEIGVPDRKFSGLLIEGIERSGKSRLLDAFVVIVCNKKIKPIKLSLHITYAEKAYSVIYHIIMQIFDAEDCETVKEREKMLLNKLGNVLTLENYCYLNVLLRVRFPLSNAYCLDTDQERYTKTLYIFELILKQLKTRICILLDDVQYLDYESWQFLSLALNNYDVVVAMTILKSESGEDVSQIKAEFYKDKRLMKHSLFGLNVNLLSAFACQFLNVLAIPKKLHRTLQRRKDGYIGWCEMLLTLILQSDGLDFIKVSPNEATQYDLVFPNNTLVTKIPIDLTPEELPPPLPWTQMSLVDICITNKNYTTIAGKDRDITELMGEIYERMNHYEQDFIKCAATLGRVFKRSVIDNVMVNSIPLHTTKTVSEMIRMRILECASLQRRDFHTEDLIFCIDKKRQTFSDMHHLLSCNCHQPRAVLNRYVLPLYAHCKMLEFKVNLFWKIMYNIQTSEKLQEHHRRAAKIYSLDARKCSFCGNYRFLRILSEDILKEFEENNMKHMLQSPRVSIIRRRTVIASKWTVSRPNINIIKAINAAKKENAAIHRVSIMPTNDDEDDDVPGNEKNKTAYQLLRFRFQSSSISPETENPSHPWLLEKFSHIDYRNCQCDNIISQLFWMLQLHIEKSGETGKILKFLIEYSVGMIQIAQPLYALKLLSIAAERSTVPEINGIIDDNAKDNITDRGIILALMGDAHIALGNYDQAKKYYLSAAKLRSAQSKLEKGIYLSNILQMFCKVKESPPLHMIDEESKRLIVEKYEMGSYLRRLCVVLTLNDKLKAAQSYALRGFNLVFFSTNSFREKGELYLATLRVFYCMRNVKLIRRIEKSMITVTEKKTSWNDSEEITMVANIYLTIYQNRVLRGELEEAIDMGIKVLKISEVLHLNELMLTTMPSLIQIMLWTKRISEAVDLIQELYFLADEDVDLSAKTWYYALSLDLMLDAGIVLESYETSHTYYKNITAKRSKFCIWRDPQSLCHLLTNLRIYQLRTRQTVNNFLYNTEKYMKDIAWYNFSQLLICSKEFECYLLMLLHCINIKRSNELQKLRQDISDIIKCLKNVSKHAKVVKPRLYLLMAYFNVLRGCQSSARYYLNKAQKYAISQGNQLTMAWIIQNRKMWQKKIYDIISQRWLEHIESKDVLVWQYICNFNADTWSTILYPLPTPDAHL